MTRILTVGISRRFTLVEILVVLVIMSLVFMLVVPRTAREPAGIAVRMAKQNIQKPFRMASLGARTGGKNVTVILDQENSRFSLSPGLTNKKGTVSDFSVPKGVTFDDFTDSNVTYTFFSNGSASGPDLHYVCRKRQFILSIDKLTSRIAIKEVDEK